MTRTPAPSDFVDEAYSIEDEASMVDFYRRWAEDYDRQMLVELQYVSPTEIARLLAEYLTDTGADILDAGCGTGLTCTYLAEAGYTGLDGIDLSPDMVRVAAGRGIYRELLVGDLNQPLAREDASYDGVISSGTFTHGHVGPEPLTEFFRILRPGGILACTVHQDLWEPMGFATRFDQLTRDGTAVLVSRELAPYFADREPEGWFCVYRKLG